MRYLASIKIASATVFLSALVFLSPCQAEEKSPEVRHPFTGTSTHFSHKKKKMEKWDAEKLMPLIADAGFGWIRDEVLWREVELQKGVYQIPEKTQKWIDLANKYNFKVIVTFNNANKIYDDPLDPDAFAKAAAYVAKTLKGKIHCFEIMNEPFNPGYEFGKLTGGGTWNGMEKDGSLSPWLKKYHIILNKTAEAVRAANPTIKIIALPQVAPANFRMLPLGISPAVDGIDEHPYSFRTIPEIIPFPATEKVLKRDGIACADETGSFVSMIRMYREQSAKHKGPKEIWLTEQGYTTYREGGRKALYSGFSEIAQAKYLQRRFMECLGLGVEMSIQYDFYEDGEDSFEAEDRFGLIRHESYEPKPAFYAMKNLNRATASLERTELTGCKIIPFSDRTESRPVTWDGTTLSLPGLIRAYEFKDSNKNKVIAVWSAESLNDLQPRAADIEIDLNPEKYSVEVLDLMSNQTSRPDVKNKAGRIFLERLVIPDYPILIKVKSN